MMTLKITKRNIPKLKEKLWRLVSEYTRRSQSNLDGYVYCYTCDKPYHWKKMDTGHYYHNKSLPLHFEPRNINPQCIRCNHHLGGNKDQYALRLEKEYGMGILQELIALDKPMPQAHLWLETKIEEYKKKLDELHW